MDKLKPILAQKFWILSAICLILPLTGWWLATGAMAQTFQTRKKAIDDAFSGIPQPGPNNNWTMRVEALNKEEEQKVKQTGDFLWGQQLELMTWPKDVVDGVEKAGYRGEIAAKTRSDYRSAYEVEIVELHKIPSPLDPLTGEGLVDFPIEIIPYLGWGASNIPPSSVEMWDTQEDIWLYRSLLQAVATINKQYGSLSIVDSVIKQIKYLELRGGTPGGAKAAAEAAGALAGAGAEGAAGAGAMPGMPGPGGPRGAEGGGLSGLLGGASGGGDSMNASFDPAEQLGSDEMAAPTPEGGADPAAAGAAGPGGPAGPGGLGMMAGGQATVKKRYIDETPKYKTRGFYMEVVMDHRKLPEFIAELSDSRWPVRVIRVQQVDVDLADVNATAGVGTTGPGGGRGPGMGRPGGMPGAMPGGRGAEMRGGAGIGRPGPAAGAGGIGRAAPRPAGGVPRGGIGAEGGVTESTVDVQAAMSDPYLVNVALSGIFTLYLPPEAPAGAEGAPAAGDPAASTPAAGTPAAAPAATTAVDPNATTAAGTTPPTTADKAATAPADPAAAPAEAKPATETKPAADGDKPAADAKPEEKPAETKPAEEKPGAEPPAASSAPAAKPESKPETPPAAKP